MNNATAYARARKAIVELTESLTITDVTAEAVMKQLREEFKIEPKDPHVRSSPRIFKLR